MTETVDQPMTAQWVSNGIISNVTVASLKAIAGAGNVFTVPATITIYLAGQHHMFRKGVPYVLTSAQVAALTAAGAPPTVA